jgi:hypothetical protein
MAGARHADAARQLGLDPVDRAHDQGLEIHPVPHGYHLLGRLSKP